MVCTVENLDWYVLVDTLYLFLVPVPAGGGTFLSPDKKVPKEAGLGEALTAKPIFLLSQVYPAVARL